MVRILYSAAEYFKDCAAAYDVMQRREERDKFSQREFQRLDYLVYRCRLMINVVDEEYRLYEDTLQGKRRVSRQERAETAGGERTSVFKRLYSNGTAITHSEAKDAKPFYDDEEKSLEKTIAANLHKILPAKSGSQPIVITNMIMR